MSLSPSITKLKVIYWNTNRSIARSVCGQINIGHEPGLTNTKMLDSFQRRLFLSLLLLEHLFIKMYL